MTYEEFREEYCWKCGTQSCPAEPEDLSYCGYYKGDIPDIPKYTSLMEEFESWMKEAGITWEDLRKEYEQSKKEVKTKGIRGSFNGHFYIEVLEDASDDDIRKQVDSYIDSLDDYLETYASIDEYGWSKCYD